MCFSRILIIYLAALLALVGCGTAASSGAVAATATAPTAHAESTVAPIPTPVVLTPTLTPAPDLAALKAKITAALPANALNPVTDGESGVQIMRLSAMVNARPLWVAYSTGLAINADFQHFVALYTHADGGWVELARATLTHPSILRDASVVEESITPDQIWLGVRGDSGLVGPCCYDLLHFDGKALQNELSFVDRTIDSVTTRVGNDQRPEVVIVVNPRRGAEGSPAPLTTTVFFWDGQRMMQRA